MRYNVKKLREIQRIIGRNIDLKDRFDNVKTIAGFDVAIEDDTLICAAVVVSFPDMKILENFTRKVEPFKVPVFPQITILKSVGMARFMSRHMEGVVIPEDVIDRLAKAPDKTKEGIAIAADTIQKLKGFCRGMLLVAIGGEERLAEVLEQVGV